ncbi:MAG: symporter small accessory protein [Methanomassiliicoccales archaeon]
MAAIVGGKEVLGIDDPWIIAGFIVLFGSTIACVVYGVLYYNKDVDDED